MFALERQLRTASWQGKEWPGQIVQGPRISEIMGSLMQNATLGVQAADCGASPAPLRHGNGAEKSGKGVVRASPAHQSKKTPPKRAFFSRELAHSRGVQAREAPPRSAERQRAEQARLAGVCGHLVIDGQPSLI